MKTSFNYYEIVQEGNIATVYLNRPDKRNAMNWDAWDELPKVIEEINGENSIRAFVIAARGKSFTTGLDILEFSELLKSYTDPNLAEERMKFYRVIQHMQSGINAVYNSNKPSIAVVQKHCIGGGLDLISACDIRYCSEDAIFSLREAKVAIVADMGSINRLPAIIGQGNTRELALTGKDIDSKEAFRMGLVNKVFADQESAYNEALNTAREIAENPGIVVRGVKEVMRYSEGKPLEAGLNYVCLWNSSFLASSDFHKAMNGFKTKTRPKYNEE
ncbi:MAG: crotonase/enoyl-CoA hydratase family protein [Leptospiraceae bacterium]|nr:crotonase/enoyl-CoA hydratase family protein [Leptospiraceae bacterium]MCP5511768.1 crotonase/enoyl-CoA hydratase family protein [Leptospiraceae bacterium]